MRRVENLPDVVANVWPQTSVQTRIVQLIRNTFWLASRRDWDALKRDVKPIYTAVNASAARAAFDELADKWVDRYPAIVRLWNNAWDEFIPFFDYDVEIRRVLCSTNAIESLNARYRRAVKARGHFPTEAAALKCRTRLPFAGPNGAWSATVGNALEALSTRSRSPSPTGSLPPKLLTYNAGNTVNEIVPVGRTELGWCCRSVDSMAAGG